MPTRLLLALVCGFSCGAVFSDGVIPAIRDPSRLLRAARRHDRLRTRKVHLEQALSAYRLAAELEPPEKNEARMGLVHALLFAARSASDPAARRGLLLEAGTACQSPPPLPLRSQARVFLELSWVTPEPRQAARWLDMAQERAERWRKLASGLADGYSVNSDLHFLEGRIYMRRYRLYAASDDLKESIRQFKMAVGFRPRSLRNRYALAAACRVAGDAPGFAP